MDSKVMRAIKDGLTFIPKFLADHIPYRKRKVIWGFVFLIPLLIGFVYFFLIPFGYSIIYSLSFVENKPTEGGIISTYIGLSNYIYDFTEAADINGSFTEHLVTAIIDIATDIPVILIFSLIIAVVLNTKFKGRALARAIFFMPVIFNSQAIDIALGSEGEALDLVIQNSTADLFESMFNFETFLLNANIPVGLVGFLGNASAKIYEIVTYSGVQILIFLAALQSVPKHLYEAAEIEGATKYEMFWKITFPMVSPMMLTAAVYTVVDSFLTSPLISIINTFYTPDKFSSARFGELSGYGINAAMSWIFALVSLAILGLTLLILSRMVFYYDE
jgi:ABC-type sugar transport system permease subunit